MNRLNFNHLYYFYIIAKTGSIKEASEKLFVTAATISDQLKLLEEFFNTQLFHRRNRSLILTKEGELALRYAEQIFDLGNDLTSSLRNKVFQPKLSLDIGMTHFMGHYFLYENLLSLFESSNSTLRITEGERSHLLLDLEEDKVDMVITDDKSALPSNMIAYRIGVNRTYCVAHKKFKKYQKNFPDSLSQLPFFNYTNESFLKHEIELFFMKNAISPKTIGEADDIDLLQAITAKGLAFTIVPEVAQKRFEASFDCVTLGEVKELQTYVWGVTKKNYQGIGLDILKEMEHENS